MPSAPPAAIEAALDRERPDAGEQVAAVLAVGHDRLVDADLEEQVLDIDVVVVGAARRRRPCS